MWTILIGKILHILCFYQGIFSKKFSFHNPGHVTHDTQVTHRYFWGHENSNVLPKSSERKKLKSVLDYD